jgi:TM2 domain-containing membrane protein YozV
MSSEPTAALQPAAPQRVAPPHPLDAEWMMRVHGQEYGPYSGRELQEFAREGRLEAATDVRRLNGGSWIAARTDTALCGFFAAEELPPARRAAAVELPGVSSGQGSTVVQVNNHVQAPAPVLPMEMGADKSPGVALLLSFLLCGAGQLYNGDIGKGFMMLIGCILLWLVFLGWIINIWSMVDAYSRAKTLRSMHQAYIANATRR